MCIHCLYPSTDSLISGFSTTYWTDYGDSFSTGVEAFELFFFAFFLGLPFGF